MTTKHVAGDILIRERGDTPEITITTPAVDLMGDVVEPMGGETETYLRGTRAVFLSHTYDRLPVAKTVALTKTPSGIRARFQWLESNPEAAIVREVFEEGVLGASIGFMVKEATPRASGGGWHITKWVLTEWSLTAIPANPTCTKMVERLKSLGRSGRGDELELDDDHNEIDEGMLAEVLPGALAAAIREGFRQSVTRGVGQAIAKASGRIWDGDADGSVLDVVDDGRGHEIVDIGVSLNELRALVLEVTAGALRETVREQAAGVIRRALGRID